MDLLKHGIRFLLLSCGLFLLPPLSHAQFVVGPPPWSSTSIQTTGGITYFSHTATLDLCDYTTTTYQGRSGTNLSMYAAEMQGQICPDCFGCTYAEDGVAVFGSLPPGRYALYLYAPSFASPTPSLYWVAYFQVPSDPVPTLKISNGPNANQVTIQVTGHPLANYTLQGSSDLKTWKNIATQSGAPCSFQLSTAGLPKFFQVQITGDPHSH
jgi:hypothetical protein